MLPRLESSLFDWQAWRRRSVLDVLGPRLRCRTRDLTSPDGKARLRLFAVGWCPSERTPCRPKLENVAVMFWVDGDEFWFHLRKAEFEEVFIET